MFAEKLEEFDSGGAAVSHSKEVLSLAYIQTLCAATGLNYESPRIDNDGIDICVRGKNFSGIFKEPKVEFQLKCTSTIEEIDMKKQEFTYQLPSKNYNYLIGPSPVPLLLIVHLAPQTREEWIQTCNLGTTIRYSSYWYSLYGENRIEKSSRAIKIPFSQRLDASTLLRIMKAASEGKFIYNLGEEK